MRHQWAPNDRGLHQSKNVPTGLLQQNHWYYGILCVKIHKIDSFFLKRDKTPNHYVMYSKPVTLKQFYKCSCHIFSKVETREEPSH